MRRSSSTSGEPGAGGGRAARPAAVATPGTRRDLLPLLTGLVALAVYAAQGFNGALIRDIGVYSYGGQQVAEGVPPYVAIINRAGPLAHLLPGIAAWVADHVGVDDLLGMRVLFAVLSAAAVAAAYVLARDLLGSRAAGLAGAAALLPLHDFVYFATNGPREKTAMLLLAVLALLAVAHRRWATAGVLIGLATLTWQPVLFAALPAAVVAALLQRRDRVRALVRVALGGLVPLAATVLFYGLIGRMRDFWDCFLLINLHYTNQPSPLGNPDSFWRHQSHAYGWTVWVIVGGLLLHLAWAARAALSPDRREPRTAALAATGAYTLGNLLWASRAYNGPPDAFVMFPGVVLGVAGLVPLLTRHLSRRAVLGAAAAWVSVAVALTAVYAVGSRDDTLLRQRAEVRGVVAALPPGSRMLSVSAPQALVLAHERNLSRLQLFGSGLTHYFNDTWPGGLRGYGRWVAARQPAVVAVGEDHVKPWLRPVLRDAYARVGRSQGWAWYARTDLGHPTLARLRDVLA